MRMRWVLPGTGHRGVGQRLWEVTSPSLGEWTCGLSELESLSALAAEPSFHAHPSAGFRLSAQGDFLARSLRWSLPGRPGGHRQ